ncbi:MAG: hypothetical protein K2K70_14675 [Lachnospiraceae bacterium]|nr:hypothetical protein [Lachnospiraceae bacterium]
MRGKLLADWKFKFDRLNREIEDNQSRLQYIRKRKEHLKTDIMIQVFFSVVSIIVIAWLYSWREDIDAIGMYGTAFMPFFLAAIFLLSLTALIYNAKCFIRQIYNMIYHNNGIMEINYPKQELVRENYPQHITRNIYEELMCVEWLLEQYKKEMVLLRRIKEPLETAPEEELPRLKKELDGIIFYQKVRPSKRR